jgi:NAD(P) transhydrogenase subunit alpha
MSATNFIHGIVLVGALTIAAGAHDALGYVIAVAAVLLGTLNVVGGWVVTDRMLEMFKRRPDTGGAATPRRPGAESAGRAGEERATPAPDSSSPAPGH